MVVPTEVARRYDNHAAVYPGIEEYVDRRQQKRREADRVDVGKVTIGPYGLAIFSTPKSTRTELERGAVGFQDVVINVHGEDVAQRAVPGFIVTGQSTLEISGNVLVVPQLAVPTLIRAHETLDRSRERILGHNTDNRSPVENLSIALTNTEVSGTTYSAFMTTRLTRHGEVIIGAAAANRPGSVELRVPQDSLEVLPPLAAPTVEQMFYI